MIRQLIFMVRSSTRTFQIDDRALRLLSRNVGAEAGKELSVLPLPPLRFTAPFPQDNYCLEPGRAGLFLKITNQLSKHF
jgi:hypothetical protein